MRDNFIELMHMGGVVVLPRNQYDDMVRKEQISSGNYSELQNHSQNLEDKVRELRNRNAKLSNALVDKYISLWKLEQFSMESVRNFYNIGCAISMEDIDYLRKLGIKDCQIDNRIFLAKQKYDKEHQSNEEDKEVNE